MVNVWVVVDPLVVVPIAIEGQELVRLQVSASGLQYSIALLIAVTLVTCFQSALPEPITKVLDA